MKSWLRKLANSFSRKPESATETTWHAEDFRPAPARPAPLDPWAVDPPAKALLDGPGAATHLRAIPLLPPPSPLPQETTGQFASGGIGLMHELTGRSESDAGYGDTSPPPERFPPELGVPPPNASEQEVSSELVSAAGEVYWDDSAPKMPALLPTRPEPHETVGPIASHSDCDDCVSTDPPNETAASAAPRGEDRRVRLHPPLESIPPELDASPALAFVQADFPGANIVPNRTASSFIQPALQDSSNAPISFADWDDVGPIGAPPDPAAPTEKLDDNFDLPDYDPSLSQRLGDAGWAATTPHDSLARQRAGMIAALLDVASRHEAAAALVWLEAFFLERRRASTFLAIEAAALEGLDFLTLRAMAELKDVWVEKPEWWVYRLRTTRANLGGTPTERLPRGDIALSWKLARRICLARCDYPPEEMIDPEWLAEWYALPPSAPGAAFFTTFLQEKTETILAGQLHEGLTAKEREHDPPAGRHRLSPSQPLRCGPEDEMISPTMVDMTSQRQRKSEDDT